jgi:serine/threonine protein kinase
MKVCSTCYRLYPDDGGFCPIDGQKLGPIESVPAPSDPEDKRVGSTTCKGRYKIFRRVADGGMGRVYQALDTAATTTDGQPTERSVALKILHTEVARDPVSVERFKREYEFSKTLKHDHIVEVLSFEQTEDQTFALVMEYLEGEELRMLLKREKTMPPERLIRMLSQLALGLAGAHERKIVHRDLKPDNVFLGHTPEGDISKILDFGSVRDNNENAKKLTVLGTTIGSPYYMAPEQAQGLPSLDHRADVWSAAAIAYECLTGKVPFGGSSGPSILLAILTQDPVSPSEVGKALNVPETLDIVMEKALAKDPDLRQKSVGELADDVGAAYGLAGDHREWAKTSQDALRQSIADRLPEKLAAYKSSSVDSSSMEQAFGASTPSVSPYQAGSLGGPPAGTGFGVVGQDHSIPITKLPGWVVPVAIGGALVVLLLLVYQFAM